MRLLIQWYKRQPQWIQAPIFAVAYTIGIFSIAIIAVKIVRFLGF